MGFDPKSFVASSKAGDLIAELVERAYQRGYADALQRVVAIAQNDSTPSVDAQTNDAAKAQEDLAHSLLITDEEVNAAIDDWANRPRKARRGIVGPTVDAVLAKHPGLTVSDYERLVVEREPEIAVKTVGNHLRAGERDGKYRRDKPGGYHWFLVNNEIEAEPDQFIPGRSPASHSH